MPCHGIYRDNVKQSQRKLKQCCPAAGELIALNGHFAGFLFLFPTVTSTTVLFVLVPTNNTHFEQIVQMLFYYEIMRNEFKQQFLGQGLQSKQLV